MKHVWNMPFGNYQQSTVITQPDKQLFLFYYQPQQNQWQRPKVSAECPLIFVCFSAICAATTLPCENHCTCYSQGVMVFDNRFQEMNSRKTGYAWVIIAPFYWQGFHTDQNLMGFIINSDDSSPLCLAFYWCKTKWKVDISQITSDWSCPSVSSKWERLTLPLNL